MKRLLLILTLFLLFLNPAFSAMKTVKKDISVQSIDGFNIKASLEYPKIKGKKTYSTVVLLHSLGYSSEWWESLPNELLTEGYAIIKIDLRGHGKSVYNSRLIKNSWKDMTNNAYSKYPDDIVAVLNYVKKENPKRIFFSNWAIVGADIGASAGVLASDKLQFKPKTIVMLSPLVTVRGLYIPVKLADLTDTDILCVTGTNDNTGDSSAMYLQKFAQAGFVRYKSEAKTTGVLMLKNDPSLSKVIAKWLKEYL